MKNVEYNPTLVEAPKQVMNSLIRILVLLVIIRILLSFKTKTSNELNRYSSINFFFYDFNSLRDKTRESIKREREFRIF